MIGVYPDDISNLVVVFPNDPIIGLKNYDRPSSNWIDLTDKPIFGRKDCQDDPYCVELILIIEIVYHK